MKILPLLVLRQALQHSLTNKDSFPPRVLTAKPPDKSGQGMRGETRELNFMMLINFNHDSYQDACLVQALATTNSSYALMNAL